MKWLCMVFLVGNAAYLGWELNDRIYHRPRPVKVEAIPANTAELQLLGELAELPMERADAPDMPIEAVSEIPDSTVGTTDVEAAAAVQESAALDTDIDPSQILEDPALDDDVKVEPAFGAAAVFVYETPPPEQMLLSSYCFSFGPFADEQNMARRKVLLAGRVDWLRTETKRDGKRQKLFWVYLEPRESVAAAQEQLADLHRRGITDYMIIRRGGMRNAISLGLFSSQESVNNRLAELADEGYQPVVVPRYKLTKNFWLHAGSGNADLLETAAEELEEELAGRSTSCNEIAQLFPAQ